MTVNYGFPLREYQELGALDLTTHHRRILGDVVGLGKTIQAVHAANMLAEEGVRDVVVVAPAALQSQWRGQPWSDLLDVEVVSYATLARGSRNFLKADVAIFDEAHYMKTPSAKRTKNGLKVATSAQYAWLLSGTIMPNDPTELWSPLNALWPELLAKHGLTSWRRWRDKFTYWRQGTYGPIILGIKNAEQLRALLGQVMLRRDEIDVDLQLPPLRLDLEMLECNTCDDSRLAGFDVESPSPEFRRMLGAVKAPLIADVVERELQDNAYEKLVLFAHHHDTLDYFAGRLKDFGLTGFDGRTGAAMRDLAVKQFTHDPDYRIMLMQDQAGGVGLNLQAATQVVISEPDWSPKNIWQQVKRIHRVGQTRPCRARLFAMEGTSDATVMRVLRRKVANIQEVEG